MPNLHDLERRINSVTSTKQITRTMEMVAAAKIRRASNRMENSLPWISALSDMLISTAAYAHLQDDPLLKKHDEVKFGSIALERTLVTINGDSEAIEEFYRLFTLRFISAGG